MPSLQTSYSSIQLTFGSYDCRKMINLVNAFTVLFDYFKLASLITNSFYLGHQMLFISPQKLSLFSKYLNFCLDFLVM